MKKQIADPQREPDVHAERFYTAEQRQDILDALTALEGALAGRTIALTETEKHLVAKAHDILKGA